MAGTRGSNRRSASGGRNLARIAVAGTVATSVPLIVAGTAHAASGSDWDRWQAIFERNKDVLGPDSNLLRAGQQLDLHD